MLDNFLTLLPKLLHKFVDELGLSLELQFKLLVLFMNLNFFLLKLLFAGSNILSGNVLLILSFSRKVVRHPLHLIQEKRPMRLLFKSDFLRLNLSPDFVSQIGELLSYGVSFLSERINQKLHKWSLRAFILGRGPTSQFCTCPLLWYLTFWSLLVPKALEQKYLPFLRFFLKVGFKALCSFLWQPYLT